VMKTIEQRLQKLLALELESLTKADLQAQLNQLIQEQQ
jgi:hypothetical protein